VHAVVRGQPLGLVAEAFGVDRVTLYRWVRRFREHGDNGLRRKPGSGRPRLVTDFDEVALNDVVLEPASQFGFETDWLFRF
jgi:transposase